MHSLVVKIYFSVNKTITLAPDASGDRVDTEADVARSRRREPSDCSDGEKDFEGTAIRGILAA
jgi:hypothetical protein